LIAGPALAKDHKDKGARGEEKFAEANANGDGAIAYADMTLRVQRAGDEARGNLHTVMIEIAEALPDAERITYFRVGLEASRRGQQRDQQNRPPRRPS